MCAKEAEAFVKMASEFCHLIENFTLSSESDKVMNLLRTISSLYAAALTLPESDLAEEKITVLDFALPDINLGDIADYWALFDPYTDEEPVACSLNDDLQDIYRDVKEGLMMYQKINGWKRHGIGNSPLNRIGGSMLCRLCVRFIGQ